MSTFRFRFLLFAFVLAGPALTSCGSDDEPTPVVQPVSTQQLTVGSWRQEEIRKNGQTTSSGSGIKDRYSLTFRTDATYSQKLLADNTIYNGTWMLMSNSTVLHLTDQKGAKNEYKLASLTTTELRYNFLNKDGQTEELVFAAQP